MPGIPRILTIAILSTVMAPLVAAGQETTNDVNDGWSPNHAALVGDRLLFFSDAQTVYFHNGSTVVPVQDFDAGDPALDVVSDFVFGLGTGAAPGEVVGAWRRGANYAWVASGTTTLTPVPVDTFAANPFTPGQPMNPEWVAIADGCVFMIMQANVGGQVVKSVFSIDPLTGGTLHVSENDAVAGSDNVQTDGCEAVWTWNPNDSGSGDTLLTELHHWDGISRTTLDVGAISMSELHYRDGRVLYVKEIGDVEQVVLLDLGTTPPTTRIVSTSTRRKVAPQTDGEHTVWGERTATTGVDIVLEGGLVLPRTVDHRAQRSGPWPFLLADGQLLWNDAAGALRILADNQVALPALGTATDARIAWLSEGWLAWIGKPTGENDNEIYRQQGTPPVASAGPAPPLRVEAEIGPGFATLRFSSVRDADSYTIYLAEEPGVDADNWQTLPGGRRIPGVTSPATIAGIDPSQPYHFVVATVRDGTEGPVSGPAAPQAFVVDTTDDGLDENPGDGICQAASGQCTLRAATAEAAIRGAGDSVVVPAGTYELDPLIADADGATQGDLDVLGAQVVVGAGPAATIIRGTSGQCALNVGHAGVAHRSTLRGLTLDGGPRGLCNAALLELRDVTIQNAGSLGAFETGAALSSSGEWLEIVDATIVDNRTSSHAGGLFLNAPAAGRVILRRTRLERNVAGIGGGAIYNMNADLELIDTVFRGNRSNHSQNWNGGAIFNEQGRIRISGSSFIGNVSPDCGGAIYNGSGEITAVNSTFADNFAANAGGALCTQGFSTPGRLGLSNVTLFDNTSLAGSAVAILGVGTVVLRNSVLYNGTGLPNCSGVIDDGGYNLDGGDSCGFGATSLVDTDPLLGDPGDNGGPTPTALPGDGSPLIDAANPDDCRDGFGVAVATDQRGVPRPSDGDDDGEARCDIGAVEIGPLCSGVPGPVTDLRFDDPETLVWTAPAPLDGTWQFDVAVASAPAFWDPAAEAVCADRGLVGATWPAKATPDSGAILYVLVRAVDACANGGSWGVDSTGAERSVTACDVE